MLALLQCTSMYPIPENEVNLNVMDSYRTKYKLSVGYSDHTEDQEALYISVIKGAKILEFHFTDDKNNTTFRDHKVSLDNADIKMLIERIKRFNIISGLKTKNPTQSEIENNHVESFRRALYFNKNMEMNQVIKSNDIISLRPNVGIDARHYHDIIGKKLRVNVEKLSVLDFNMFYENKLPLVTVYITNHNYGKYLKESIESVLNQSFKDFELIIIDDGSNDNSKEILQLYENNSKIKVIYQNNKGLTISNNIALKLSRSEYIMRLDADDYLHKDGLKNLLSGFESEKIGMVFGDWYEIDEYGDIIERKKKTQF